MRGQGLPVNMIVLTALALLVLVVVAAFFITGMSGAAQQTSIVRANQSYCNALCGQMVVAANNANTPAELNKIAIARTYQGSGCAREYGCCMVTLRSGDQFCAEGNCLSVADCTSLIFPDAGDYVAGDSVEGWSGYTFEGTALFPGHKLVAEPACVGSKCVVGLFIARGSDCNSACSGMSIGSTWITNDGGATIEELCRCY